MSDGRTRAKRRFHPLAEWTAGHPGLVAGVTEVMPGEGAGSDSDYGLTSGGDVETLERRYVRLARAAGMFSAAVGRQVHGVTIHEVEAVEPQRLHIVGEVDGLVTGEPGILLAVTAADCVPVFVADTGLRCVGMLHAGWRGASAGILPEGLAELRRLFDVSPESLRIHLGPSICGTCYEVGAEVLQAFGRPPVGPALLDLRSELEAQAAEAGVPPASITRSEWCTRCGSVPLHSHRASGPEAGRMAAFVGIQPGPDWRIGSEGGNCAPERAPLG